MLRFQEIPLQGLVCPIHIQVRDYNVNTDRSDDLNSCGKNQLLVGNALKKTFCLISRRCHKDQNAAMCTNHLFFILMFYFQKE